jgi:signal transduction histidine kinase/HAMP domain-containing protein/ActR/RegA family two-component response regulator
MAKAGEPRRRAVSRAATARPGARPAAAGPSAADPAASHPAAPDTGRQLTDPRLQQLLAGLRAVRDGDFGIRLGKVGDPLVDEIATVFNEMVDQLALFTSEVTRVAREVGTEGRLGGQADIKGVSGSWKDLTESVNAMAGNLTGQVRDIAQVATAVAGGDLSQKITVDVRGEMLELKETINTMVDQLSSFADEVTRVAREVGTEGRLGGQANVKGVSGTWKDLTDNVNSMASNLTSQVRSIAEVTTAVARGDLSRTIRVDARGEIQELKETINTMVDQLSSFADEVTRVAREVGTEGRLGGQADVKGVSGTWKDLTDNVNSMASNLTGQVRNIAQVTTAVAQGDLSKKIDVDARGEILALKTTINTMVDQLSAFAAEVTRVAREVGRHGRLGGQAEVEGVAGTWKRLTEDVNELAGNLTRQVRAIAEVASAVATGDLTGSISVEAQGEVAELKDNINAMVQSLRETTSANAEQVWLQASLARIARVMQGHRDLETVADVIMEEMVPLIGAQHGTFFLAETMDGEPRLRLIAGYGLRHDPESPSQYRLGQSLIGQVAKTKRPLLVNGVPAGYVKISSGLGEATPVNLIVMPIVFEGQVLGVIEASSFSPFTRTHQDFLEQLMEVIGVNVNAILANVRTDALLEESRRLAAELQIRQQELQRSNDDLEDKAAQLARQNRDIESKNAEIEQARQEIEERARQLALASRYKSQFLANVSHELRTPLNSLLILARLLAQNTDGNLTGKQVEYANVIHSSGSDLLQLINDILDLSKAEAGRMEINPEQVALATLADDLSSVFAPLAADKKLDFSIGLAGDLPRELVTDRQRLRQILANLLSNAIKFTPAGRVDLSVRLAGPAVPGGEPQIEFVVTDTGIGISADNLSIIFGAFQQGDGTTSRGYGGTGLGLAICREVAAHLGGRITAASQLGGGSTFTLLLPRSLPSGPSPAREPGNGQGHPAPRSDQIWPNGRAASPTAPGPGPVHATGNAPTDQVPAPRAPAPQLGPHHALRERKVLIIDDDVRNVFAITSILELYGLSVIHAPDGRQGIAALQATEDIDLVLMDVMMPEMDGYATTEAIRGIPRLADLPVIAVTARAMPEDRARSIASGATDYVTKPVDTEELLACMERCLTGPASRPG